ncbi:MAG: DUF6089 family protein [Bacteroidota bacterium]|nr:DUF6089 family protein [Bacteroidota bacterium]
MLRILPIILFSICSLSVVNAQVNEVGITVGGSYYIGDLNPTRHFPKHTGLTGGILFRHNLNERLAIRFQGIYGALEAYDSDGKDTIQWLRNLHFRSPLIEGSLLFEINFFKYRSRKKDGKNWTPFVFGGLAYFRTNPQAYFNDEWHDLQPLGTEGQGTTARGEDYYKIDNIAIPFGAGLKLNAGRVDFQLEWGMRRTYTDHIDDVHGTYVDNAVLAFENGPLSAILADRSGLNSPFYTNTDRQRGDMNTRDWYIYSGLSITYIISRFSDCDEQYNWMKRKT